MPLILFQTVSTASWYVYWTWFFDLTNSDVLSLCLFHLLFSHAETQQCCPHKNQQNTASRIKTYWLRNCLIVKKVQKSQFSPSSATRTKIQIVLLVNDIHMAWLFSMLLMKLIGDHFNQKLVELSFVLLSSSEDSDNWISSCSHRSVTPVVCRTSGPLPRSTSYAIVVPSSLQPSEQPTGAPSQPSSMNPLMLAAIESA